MLARLHLATSFDWMIINRLNTSYKTLRDADTVVLNEKLFVLNELSWKKAFAVYLIVRSGLQDIIYNLYFEIYKIKRMSRVNKLNIYIILVHERPSLIINFLGINIHGFVVTN